MLKVTNEVNDDVFSDLQQKYFENARRGGEHFSCLHHLLLSALDSCTLNTASFGRAGKALVESAVIDSWAKFFKLSVVQLLNLKSE